jgi:hypothetical protein
MVNHKLSASWVAVSTHSEVAHLPICISSELHRESEFVVSATNIIIRFRGRCRCGCRCGSRGRCWCGLGSRCRGGSGGGSRGRCWCGSRGWIWGWLGATATAASNSLKDFCAAKVVIGAFFDYISVDLELVAWTSTAAETNNKNNEK